MKSHPRLGGTGQDWADEESEEVPEAPPEASALLRFTTVFGQRLLETVPTSQETARHFVVRMRMRVAYRRLLIGSRFDRRACGDRRSRTLADVLNLALMRTGAVSRVCFLRCTFERKRLHT